MALSEGIGVGEWNEAARPGPERRRKWNLIGLPLRDQSKHDDALGWQGDIECSPTDLVIRSGQGLDGHLFCLTRIVVAVFGFTCYDLCARNRIR